jgi:hypothetical protein
MSLRRNPNPLVAQFALPSGQGPPERGWTNGSGCPHGIHTCWDPRSVSSYPYFCNDARYSGRQGEPGSRRHTGTVFTGSPIYRRRPHNASTAWYGCHERTTAVRYHERRQFPRKWRTGLPCCSVLNGERRVRTRAPLCHLPHALLWRSACNRRHASTRLISQAQRCGHSHAPLDMGLSLQG